MAEKLYWTDGTEIKNSEIRRLFASGRITGRHVFPSGQWKWLARCEHDGCQNSYLVKIAQNARCKEHRRSLFIGGKTTNSLIPERFHEKLVWRRVVRGGITTSEACYPCEGLHCSHLVRVATGWDRIKILCKKCAPAHNRMLPYQVLYNALLAQIKMRNARRLIMKKPLLVVDLSYAEYRHICEKEKNCYYCGDVLLRYAHATHKNNRTYDRGSPCLDRIDETKGYLRTNVVSCCGVCNFTKNNFVSQVEMQVLGAIRSGRQEEAVALIENAARENAAWGLEVKKKWARRCAAWRQQKAKL